jgi:transcriptional regulator with XRE-family HTH domain
MLIGARIREIRKAQGLTQEDVAEKAGMDFTSIGAVERGARNSSLKSLFRIAEALNVSLEELVRLPQDSILLDKNKKMTMLRLEALIKDMEAEELKFILEIIEKICEYIKAPSKRPPLSG